MKLSLIFVSAILTLGCAKAAPPPKPIEAPIHKASVEDCTHVYERVLSIVLTEELEPEQLFSKEAVQAAGQLLDDQYTKSGKKQLLFSVCTQQFNSDQIKCMVTSNSLEDMDVCAHLFKSKE